MSKNADIIGAIILTLLSAWFLFKMDAANTIIGVLKYGFIFLAVVIQLVSITSRRQEG